MKSQSIEKLYQTILQLLPTTSEHEREEIELTLDEAVDAMDKGVNGVFTFPSADVNTIQSVIKALNRVHLDVTAVIPTETKVWITWKVNY